MAFASGTLPLFLQAEPVNPVDAALELALHGTAGTGMFGGVPLHTFSDASGNLRTAELPLFVGAPLSDTTTANLNLWVGGVNQSLTAGVDLICWNAESGVQKGLNLFTQGSGITAGALPFESSLSLFIRRIPSSAISLYVAGPGEPSSSGMPLFVRGAPTVSSGVPFAMPDVLGFTTSNVRLFTHGF